MLALKGSQSVPSLIPKSTSSAKDRNLREDLQHCIKPKKSNATQWSDPAIPCIFFPDLWSSPNTPCICRLVSPVRSPLTLLAPLAPRSWRKAFTSCFLLPSKAVATFWAVLVEMPLTWRGKKEVSCFENRCSLLKTCCACFLHMYLLSSIVNPSQLQL